MTHTHRFARTAGLLGLAAASFTLASCNQSGTPGGSQSAPIPGVIAPNANYHADWSNQPAFVQNAIAVQGRHEGDLLKMDGVIGDGVGLDEANPNSAVILVFTDHDGVPNIPATIEGLRTRIEMVGHVTALQGIGNVKDDGKTHGGGGSGTGVSYTSKVRSPIPAGISTGEDEAVSGFGVCEAGSIGAMVTTSGISSSPSYEATGSSSDVLTTYSTSYSASTPHYMLSCNHVFADENAASSAVQEDQPGSYDNSCVSGNGVGELYAFNYIDPSNNNYYDVALAQCDPSQTWTPKMQGNWYTPSNTVVAPTVGTAVQKVGRTTGHTSGTIAGINVTIKVSYTNFTATFVDQIYVRGSFIKSGDSGSMMVTSSGYNPVGLNFAGGSNSSFANRMDHIAADFGLSFPQSSF